MLLDLDDDWQIVYMRFCSPIAMTTCYGNQNFEILMHDVLQIMLLVQYMHKWSNICLTSLSINIFAQLMSHFYSHNCSTHRVSAASKCVAMSVQKNWFIINISKLTWRKGCKRNRWVFQTFWPMKLKKGIALSSANRLGRWLTINVHIIVLPDCYWQLVTASKILKYWCTITCK